MTGASSSEKSLNDLINLLEVNGRLVGLESIRRPIQYYISAVHSIVSMVQRFD